jgi:hypothetical protein
MMNLPSVAVGDATCAATPASGFEGEGFAGEAFEDEGFEDEAFEDEGFEDEGFEDEAFEDEAFEDEGFEDERYEDEGFGLGIIDKALSGTPRSISAVTSAFATGAPAPSTIVPVIRTPVVSGSDGPFGARIAPVEPPPVPGTLPCVDDPRRATKRTTMPIAIASSASTNTL